jgi:nucleoid-associated protein YgaU
MRTDVKIGVAVGLCFVIGFIFYYMIIVDGDEETAGPEQETIQADSDSADRNRPEVDAGRDDEGTTIASRDHSDGGSSVFDTTDRRGTGLLGDGPGTDTEGGSLAMEDPSEDDTADAGGGLLGGPAEDPGTPGGGLVGGGLDDPDTTDTTDPMDDSAQDDDEELRIGLGNVTPPADIGRREGGGLLGGGMDEPEEPEPAAGGGLLGRRDPLPTETAQWYEVREGETLSDIARAHYGKASYYRDILAANPDVDEHRLRPGQRLRLPPVSEVVRSDRTEATVTGGDPDLPGGWKAHKIRSGDTLGALSQQYYGSTRYWKSIAGANPDVDPNNLKLGNVLRIPPRSQIVSDSDSRDAGTTRRSPTTQAPPGWKVHVVAEGDMLSTISSRYYGTSRYWPLLQEKNPGINPNNMKVGDEILIPPKPAGDAPPIPVPASPSEPERSTDPDDYDFPRPNFE